MKLLSRLVIYSALILVISGCGGGSPEGEPPEPPVPVATTVTLTGIVQKGPFESLNVTAFVVNPLTAVKGSAITAQITDQEYTVDVPDDSPILLEATGTFINELNGESVLLENPLSALVDVQTTDNIVNINPLTDFVADRTLEQFSSSVEFSEQLELATDFVLDAFGIDNTIEPTSLNVNDIDAQSTITSPDVQLLLLSAFLLLDQHGANTLANLEAVGEVIAQASTVPETQYLLGSFVGVGAQGLYDYVLDQDVITGLPTLDFGVSQAWACDVVDGCGWIPVPEKAISIASNSIYESEGSVEIVVRLSEVSTDDVSFSISTEDISARNLDDYVGLEQQFFIPAGGLLKRIQIPVIIDKELESLELFRVHIAPTTSEYVVLNNATFANVAIKNGAGPLVNGTVSDVAVKSLCINAVGSPDTITNDGCNGPLPISYGVINNGHSVIDVVLDLEATCDSTENCDALTEDRMVEFFLLSVDTAGTQQAELSLGQYRYDVNDIQLSSASIISNSFYLSIDDYETSALMSQALEQGGSMSLQARVKEQSASSNALALMNLIPVPQELIGGDRTINIVGNAILSQDASNGCQVDQYFLSADFELRDGAIFSGSVCVDVINDNGDLTATIPIGEALDISYTSMDLPQNHVMLLARGNDYPMPIGYPSAVLSATDRNGNILPLRAWLHSEGLPFMYRISTSQLTSRGIEITYDSMRYVMSVDYSATDPRSSSGGIKSNDVMYSGVNDQVGTILIANDGIQTITPMNVNAGYEHTSFPSGRLLWGAFSQSVEQGKLSTKADFASSFFLKQSTGCEAVGCPVAAPITHNVFAGTLNMDVQGSLIGALKVNGNNMASWGAQSDSIFAFQRPQDLLISNQMDVNVFVPGFQFTLSEDEIITDYLLAHASIDNTAITHNYYTVGTEAFRKGNYFPSGLTVGPEIYSDNTGQPIVTNATDLSGKPLTINNQTDVLNLNTSVAAKYVIRNAGITGVFNIDSDELINPINIYGYPMSFDRFAIRQINNKIDTQNWVDGHTQIEGDAGLEIYFNNLQIDCSARLRQGNLTYESCDGIDNNDNNIYDENCNQRLQSWNANTELFAMSFVGASGSPIKACQVGGEQFLSLQHEVDIKALDNPVGLLASWSPLGTLLTQSLSFQDSYQFDFQDDQLETGFPIQVSTGQFSVAELTNPEVKRYGGLELFSTKVAVPFWQQINTDIRLVNKLEDGSAVSESPVVAAGGAFSKFQNTEPERLNQTNKILQQDIIDDQAENIVAQYRWGNTGVGFELPVFFANDDEQTRFIGVKQEEDLFVMNAYAGINYIEPSKTKLSFGASADFEKLASIEFQIDLDDPDNLVKVDSFLESIGVIDTPILEPSLSGLQSKVNVFNRLSNKGIDFIIEEGIKISVQQLGEALAPVTEQGKDPFVIVSESMSQIQNFPQQVNTLLKDELKKPVDAVVINIATDLRAPLDNVVTEVTSLQTGVIIPASVNTTISKAKQQVDNLHSKANQLSHTVTRPINQAKQLLEQLNGPLNDLTIATSLVEDIFVQATEVTESQCVDPQSPAPESKGYLNAVNVNLSAINDILQILNTGDTFTGFMNLVAQEQETVDRLQAAQISVKQHAEVILAHLSGTETLIRNTLCSDDTSQLIVGVKAVTSEINQTAEMLKQKLTTLDSQLGQLTQISSKLDKQLVKPLAELSQMLLNIENGLYQVADGSKTGIELLEEANTAAAEMNGSLNTLLIGPYGSGVDIFTHIVSSARPILNSEIDSVTGAFTGAITSNLPGAYYTADQLRALLVKKVMASAPVLNIRVELNTRLSEISNQIRKVVLETTDQINVVIKSVIADVESTVNDALAVADSAVKNIPLSSASIDGFGIIAGNELERMHIGADWTMSPTEDGKPGNTFAAALDAVSWNVTNKGSGCGIADSTGRLDVGISAYNLPATFMDSKINIDEVGLQFTLETQADDSIEPRAVSGGIYITGDIGMSEFKVINPALAAGIGDIETYIGASAEALFSEVVAEAAFLAGRTCDQEILNKLDPEVAKFIPIPDTGFNGVYLRGGASVPVITAGCGLTLGLSAEFGTWVLDGADYGGLVGGGAYGEVACIGSITGRIRALAQYNRSGEASFIGTGFAVAGGGSCEPETWTSVSRSRADDWCGTGDAQFGAEYSDGWSVSDLEIDWVF